MTTGTKQFLENPDYVEAASLLMQLHQVIAKGGLESEEADEIRDEMEPRWYRLTEKEIARLDVLSANLYMLSDNDIPRPVPPEQRTEAWLAPQITDAQNAGDWDTVLALLRNGPDYMTPDSLAHLRSVAYRQLGHCEIALLFADYAYQNSLKSRRQSAVTPSQFVQSA